MVHFYRGEITRSNVWRTRLDSTTNWAVVITGALITFAFGSTSNPHVVILIGLLLLSLFLIIEARRYRYYELWALRVRLMETDFFAAMLNPPFTPHQQWAMRLIDSLLTPEFPISNLEAIGRRLRRNYIWLFLILGLAWAAKLALHPSPAYSFQAFLNHATIGFVPGQTVALALTGFYAVIFIIAFLLFAGRAVVQNGVSLYAAIAGSFLDWSGILLFILPTRVIFARWINDKSLVKVILGLFLGTWMIAGVMHVVQSCITYFMFNWPEEVWVTLIPIIPFENLMRCLAGTVIGTGVIAGLRAIGLVKPTWAVY